MTEDAATGLGWLTYLKVGVALLVGLAAMVFLPQAIEGESTSDVLWVSLFMLAFGAIGLVLGFKEFRKRQIMLNTPTSKVRSLAVGDVEIKGTAHPVDEVLVSPLTHTEACVYQLEVEEEHEDDDGSDWDTVLEVTRQVPFHLDDGTGQVRVEPDEAELDVSVEQTVHVDEHQNPPGRLMDWAETDAGTELMETEIPREEGGESGIGGKITDMVESQVQLRAKRHLTEDRPHDRRYTERVLAVGEETYVFGGAYPRDGAGSATNVENLVIREHEGTGQFIVSDKSEKERAKEGVVTTAILLALALGLLPTGLIGLGRVLGIV